MSTLCDVIPRNISDWTSRYDSLIYAQLCPCSISDPNVLFKKPIIAGESVENDLSSTQDNGIHTFTLSAFIELLEMLKVSFINTNPEKSNDIFSDFLERGGSGTVVYQEIRDIDRSTTIPVAVKSFVPIEKNPGGSKDIEEISKGTITQAFIEVCIMKPPLLELRSNIVKLRGVTASTLTSSLQLSLVTEYAELGSLDLYLSLSPRSLEWKSKYNILRDVSSGLAALHDCDIIHNDVKCSNILLFPDSLHNTIIAKVADFGLSARTNNVRRRAGTQLFAPPEAYAVDCLVLPARDVYSFALVILHVAGESEPFDEITNKDAIVDLKMNENSLRHYALNILEATSFPAEVIASVLNALKIDPEKRPSMRNILEPE